MFKRKIGKRKPCRYSWRYLCCFTLNLLDGVIHDIAEVDVWCFSQTNLLILVPNKIGYALGTCGSIASGSACPSMLCVEGQWFC